MARPALSEAEDRGIDLTATSFSLARHHVSSEDGVLVAISI